MIGAHITETTVCINFGKSHGKASGVIYPTRLRLHCIPLTARLDTKLSQVNPGPGWWSAVAVAPEPLRFKFDTLNSRGSSVLKKKKKEEIYLSNIIHDTSTDLGVKPDKDLFFFFLNVSHTNSTFFFLSFFYKKRP